MTHRFRTIRKAPSTARGYGTEHTKARRAAAQRHQPTDPCCRCGKPLGPMGPWLHYDHNPTRTGYLGFAHAACNRRAGARVGNRRQARQGLPARRRPRITPIDFGIQDDPEHGTCAVCDTPFRYSHPDQKTCSRACGWIYRTGKGPRCTVRYANCKTCAEPYVQRNQQRVYCSDTCRYQASLKQKRDAYIQRPRPVYTHTCVECDDDFTGSPLARYCSRRCAKRAENRRSKQRKRTQAAA